jgi:hypothetical protein
MAVLRRRLLATVPLLALLLTVAVNADSVRVRHVEGLVHGFLVLRDTGGKAIARGELLQSARGAEVTSQLVFHFDDGSLYDETAVFSQRTSFRLIRDHLRQHGPSFPRAIDMTITVASGKVTVTYTDDGKRKTADKEMKLPPDLANGLIPVLLKNVDRQAPPKELPMIVATPEPMLVKLDLVSAQPQSFSKGDQRQRVTEYVMKPKIGGIKGLLAPLVGKEPENAHVWILEGDVPAFLAAEQQFYPQGPMWRIELSVPQWRAGDPGNP